MLTTPMYKNHQIPLELIPTDPRFGCGPTLIPETSLQALTEATPHIMGTSHRKAPVQNLVKNIEEEFRTFFKLPKDYAVVLTNGGATMLFDMIPLGLAINSSAHFTCGEFSQKWYETTKRIPHLKTQLFSADVGFGITPHLVDGVDLICLTLNETSTGVQVDSIPDAKKTSALVCVDATSGAGQIEVDMSCIDVFFFSAQKVFASEGGTAVVFLSPKAIKRIENGPKTYIPSYFNWKEHLENARKNQTLNTPSISSLLFLREHLREMNKIGSNEVYHLTQKKVQLMEEWVGAHDYLSFYVKEKKYRSKTVATIDVDEKYQVSEILQELEKQKLIYGIDAYRKLGRNQLRIALFHQISYDNLFKLTRLISHIISLPQIS